VQPHKVTSDEMMRTMIAQEMIARGLNRFKARPLLMAVVIAPVLALGGCFEGTEVNGKIFDLLGVSTASQDRARAEPKMTPRSGLVLPPDAQRLPAPGSDDVTVAASVTSLNDPEKAKANAAAERARLHKAYCTGDLSWKERVNDPAASPKSPYGPCGLAGDLFKQ
jgi:hypothetical protein